MLTWVYFWVVERLSWPKKLLDAKKVGATLEPVQFKRRSRMRPVSVEERKANPTHNSLKKGVLWEATTVEIMVLDARI